MTRALSTALAVAAALALAVPATAASPSATVKPPTAGDVTLAHLVFTTKGGKGTPKLAVANRAKLSKQLTIAGGVAKLKKNTFLASIALLHRTGGGSSATPSFKLTLPKGMKFGKFTAKQIAKNLLSTSTTPKFCSARPTSFGYVSKKLLNGSFPPRFSSALDLVLAGYELNCPGGYDERANLAAALRGEPDPGAAGGGSGSDGGGGEDGGEDGEEGEGGGGSTMSPTLRGSGTVFAEAGRTFRYEISFNEPVYHFTIDAPAAVRCPTQYGAWKPDCDAMGNSQTVSAGGQTLTCVPGELSYQFECATPAPSHTKPSSRATVPAGAVIVGRYELDAGTTSSSPVRLTGIGPSGRSPTVTLAGP